MRDKPIAGGSERCETRIARSRAMPPMRRVLGRVLVLLVAVLCVAPAAAADTGVLPNDGNLPWTDPAHHSPLEQLATQIASHIAGRQATVQCDGQNDWNTLAAQFRFDPSYELGFVPWRYWLASRLIADGGNVEFLSPTVCWNLEQFGVAPLKPTKCTPLVSQQTTRIVTERYRVTVRVKVRGKWVTKKVWRIRQTQQTVTTQVPGPPAPCYLGNGNTATAEPQSYWDTYRASAQAIWVLAHESIHVQEDLPGTSIDALLPMSETKANCYGLQWVPYVAQQLGASPDDAEAIAKYDYEVLYPGYRNITYNGSPYWSADCYQGGPLDLTPSDGVWP